MFSFGTKTQSGRKLIIDVGSSRVNCVLASFESQRKIDILRLFQSESVIMPEADLRGLWRKTAKLVEDVIKKFRASTLKVDEALVIFSSPWYFSEVRHIERNFSEPTGIDRNFLAEILTKEESDFKLKASSNFKMNAEDLEYVSPVLMGAKLNGYPIMRPEKNLFDKKAKIFSAAIYISAFFGQATAYIKGMLDDCGIGHIEFQSSAAVFFAVLSIENYYDVSVVDIGGEITDIIMVKDGQINKISSFGRGLNYVARRIGPVFNTGLEETLILFSNYLENKLDTQFQASVAKVLQEALGQWQNLFKEALEKHMMPDLMPEKILVTGHGGGVIEFQKILSDPSLGRYTAYGRPFSIIQQTAFSARFKNSDQIFNKPHLQLLNLYLIYAAQ